MTHDDHCRFILARLDEIVEAFEVGPVKLKSIEFEAPIEVQQKLLVSMDSGPYAASIHPHYDHATGRLTLTSLGGRYRGLNVRVIQFHRADQERAA